MRIGQYKVAPVECGRLRLDGGAMFGVVPKSLWERSNPADERNRITLAMRAMLIRGAGVNLLVDCGAGDKLNEKLKDIYAVDHSESSLESSLERLGVNPGDITHVVLTHLHFDHTGGATKHVNDGELAPTFPNAEYFIHEDQWRAAFDPTPRDKASYFKENYEVLDEVGKLTLIAEETEILPGIDLIVVNGHTPGQLLVKLRLDGETLLYCGDLIPTASHVPLPYVMAYDLEPLITMNEKSKYLSRAVKGDWTLFYEHDPFRNASKVVVDDKGYRAAEEVILDSA